ncbi:MAG: discoidin domain-containing protein [Planctomycetaceae bacterium]|jgi:mono/diheme cytochrome c family protein|nr:discoidin domain-containing protein [Planctomycetaceae bacterium]
MYFNYKKLFPIFFVFVLVSSSLLCSVFAVTESNGVTKTMIETDWLKQAESWRAIVSGNMSSAPVTTQTDALGAVDGVKNGCYAFHTNREKNPWWQVDLENATQISRIIVYNRLDYASGLHNADTMKIFVSTDAKQWTLLHDCAGKHFGGISGEKPLEIVFEPKQVTARYVRLQIQNDSPIFFHLDEVEIYSFDNPSQNIALWKSANQSSLSQWSVTKTKNLSITSDRFPIDETKSRIFRFADYLKQQGLDVSNIISEVDKPTTPENAESEYLRLRRLGRKLVFANPLLDFERLLFVKRFTQQTYPDICLNHMPWVSKPGGDICILDAPFSFDGSGQKVTSLIDGQLGIGHVRGIDLWWEGDRIVFGYAKQEKFPFPNWPIPVGQERLIGHDLRLSQEPIHIYEIRTDGTGLRQITNHDFWSDLDPAYLPNGNIVFVSERCGFSLQCNNGPFHDETSCNLFSVKPDGSGLRWLSYNKDGDYQPHIFNDGTIGYCRWEYQERGWANIQSVWFIRPDGTGADALFKQHIDNPWAFENTREIPNILPSIERKFVSIAAGHHTLACGPVCILSPNQGFNNPDGIKIVTPGVFPPEGGMSGTPVSEGGCVENGGYYMYPFPLSDKFFLVSYTYSNEHRSGSSKTFRGADEIGYGLYLIDVFGNKELLYADPEISSSFPMPLRPRTRPPILAENQELSYGDRAVCTVSDVTFGVEGIRRDEVKYIRIARRIGWSYTKESGGQRYEVDGSSWGLSWAPVLVYGEVAVETDGSASFYVPSNESVYFQLLDANKQEIKRMRSFISFQPGESRSCVGCHETREVAFENQPALAIKREPSQPIPPPWGTERCINYLTDIQPVFDRHCVSCHSGLKPAAGFDFSGGLTAGSPMQTPYRRLHFDGLNRSYRTIIENNLITYSDKHASASEMTQTRQFGSARSKLIDAILSGSCSEYIKLKPESEDWYRLVTWIDANAPYHDRFVNSRPVHQPYDLTTDAKLKQSLLNIHQKRCVECHTAEEVTRLDWIDLFAPEKSYFLTAPLGSDKKGTKSCSQPVYANENDPDYVTLQTVIRNAVQQTWKYPRRDLETLFNEKDAALRKF